MNQCHTLDEKQLLSLLKEGDENAFFEIYHLYKDRIGYRLLRLLRSDELAEEVLQDVFMKVWAGRENIDPELSFKSYIYRIAQNLVIDLMRRATKERAIYDHIMASSSELYSHIEENIYRKENEQLLHSVIDMLPPQRKKVFLLFKIEGKSYKEISEELGISHSTIKEHIQKATVFVKERLTASSGLQLLLLIYLAMD
jgi:RNA polymerase sigma-70 factor (family 1)